MGTNASIRRHGVPVVLRTRAAGHRADDGTWIDGAPQRRSTWAALEPISAADMEKLEGVRFEDSQNFIIAVDASNPAPTLATVILYQPPGAESALPYIPKDIKIWRDPGGADFAEVLACYGTALDR